MSSRYFLCYFVLCVALDFYWKIERSLWIFVFQKLLFLLVVDFSEGNNSILWLKRNNYTIGPELFWAWLSFVWAGSGLCTSTGTVMVLNSCRSVLICRSVMCLRGWVALEVWIFHKGYLRLVLYESFGSERLFLHCWRMFTLSVKEKCKENW